MSYPPLYFRGMLQRIACLSWKSLAALSEAEIKEITNKTNHFLPVPKPKPVEKPHKPCLLCSTSTVMHKYL
jgi:hypothetical protein